MRLSRAGEPEGEHVDGAFEEPPGDQLFELLLELDREARPIQQIPGFPYGQLRSSTQAVDASLAAISRLEFEDFKQCRQRRAVIGGLEARDDLCRDRRQVKLGTELLDPLLGRHTHRAPSTNRAS